MTRRLRLPYALDQVDSEVIVPGIGNYEESWSGYALQRNGTGVIPFVITAMSAQGATNISSDTAGALRFWVRPYWSTGDGPGIFAPLLTFYAMADGQSLLCWWLEVSPDGSAVTLVNQTETGPQTLLSSAIDWQAGQSYLFALDFASNATALFLDNQLVAQGGPLIPIAPSAGELALGSDITGNATAGADFDEFYSFARPLNANQLTAYCVLTTNEAALGPLSDEETGMSGMSQMNNIRTPNNIYDQNTIVPCNPGGQVYFTNFTASVQTNGLMSISFVINGGLEGVFYDVYRVTDLGGILDPENWVWVGQGLTCNAYTFSNQSAGHAFYKLVQPYLTTVWAWGTNGSGQLNVPANLTNAVAVAGGTNFSMALTANGTVLAWGDNTYNETTVPATVTNAVAIAGGYLHGVAVLASGSVTNWGYYWDGSSSYCSVTNRSLATAPPTSNVLAIAAGLGQDLALMSNGTVYAWGESTAYGTQVPTNLHLTNISSIACGWGFNLALASNGTITAWGYNGLTGYNLTNVPSDLLTNTAAIAAGGYNSLALRRNGTVEALGPIQWRRDQPSVRSDERRRRCDGWKRWNGAPSKR